MTEVSPSLLLPVPCPEICLFPAWSRWVLAGEGTLFPLCFRGRDRGLPPLEPGAEILLITVIMPIIVGNR